MNNYRIRLGYFDTTFRETLWYPHDSHLIVTAPTSSGKFRDLLAGLGGTFQGSVVWVDSKLQAASVLARRISRTHDVVILNPFKVLPEFIGRYPHISSNPLDTLDPTLPSFGADCDAIVDGIVTEQGQNGDSHFPMAAKDGWSGVIAALKRHGEPEDQNLASARKLICSPGFFEFCRDVAAMTSDDFIRQKLGRFTLAKAEENREVLGILSTMAVQSSFLGNQAIADVLRSSDFRWRSLKKRPTCVFLGLPARYLSTCGKWFRLMVATAMNQLLYEERGIPTLLVLDEFAALNRLPVIQTAMGLARGFGVRLMPILQDLNQLVGIYGRDSFETFLGNASKVFFAPQDRFTAEYISHMVGSVDSRAISKSVNDERGVRSNISISAGQRYYLAPQQIRELPPNEMLVIGQGLRGFIRAGRRPYWLCPELGEFDVDPYHVTETDQSERGLFGWWKR
ncbi:MAG TPA: type IV secretory system conjugative DNA transfer family protein [Bryobacteraceae bacterium]